MNHLRLVITLFAVLVVVLGLSIVLLTGHGKNQEPGTLAQPKPEMGAPPIRGNRTPPEIRPGVRLIVCYPYGKTEQLEGVLEVNGNWIKARGSGLEQPFWINMDQVVFYSILGK